MAAVLIIEDEASIQMLLRRIIGGAGHEVITAAEAEAAFNEVAQRSFDLIFTDLSLPGGPPGAELLSNLAARAQGSSIIVVSGHLPSDVQGLCTQLGIGYFLPKPFDLSTVRNLLAQVIADRAAKQSPA
jgi:DNA-binding NtrC family response regulator